MSLFVIQKEQKLISRGIESNSPTIHIQTFWFSETFTTILGKIFAKFLLNFVIFDKILHI